MRCQNQISSGIEPTTTYLQPGLIVKAWMVKVLWVASTDFIETLLWIRFA